MLLRVPLRIGCIGFPLYKVYFQVLVSAKQLERVERGRWLIRRFPLTASIYMLHFFFIEALMRVLTQFTHLNHLCIITIIVTFHIHN